MNKVNQKTKDFLLKMLVDVGFTYDETLSIIEMDYEEIVNIYDEFISESELQTNGFRKFIEMNIDEDEFEWEYDHYCFHTCMFGKCVYCKKENEFCMYYGDYLNNLHINDVKQCAE